MPGKSKPKFRPVELKTQPGWCVLYIQGGHKADEYIPGFATKAEAQNWINYESQESLKQKKPPLMASRKSSSS
jgi:hypothetical protein